MATLWNSNGKQFEEALGTSMGNHSDNVMLEHQVCLQHD
jgi:hypothetical protein